jgi:hypothetical protein
MRDSLGAVVLAVSALTLGSGCSSSPPPAAPVSANFPYKPETPVPGPPVSAAYSVTTDRLRIEIDTGGRRLERAQIVKTDGALLDAQTIEFTQAPSGGSYGSPIGIGIGGGSFGRMGSGVGTGVGVSMGGVVGGSGGGGGSTSGNTIASFALDQAGQRPWRLRVKLEGVEPFDIVVGIT